MAWSPSRRHGLSTAWRAALLGALASVPAAALLRWLPNAAATVGGGVMIVGALLAGAIATNWAADPAAAGVRAGLLAGVVGTAELVSTVLDTAPASWSTTGVAFVGLAVVLFLVVAPLFGLVCGRVGGWVATKVGSLPTGGTDAL